MNRNSQPFLTLLLCCSIPLLATITNVSSAKSNRPDDLAARVAQLETFIGDLEERKKINDVYILYGRGIDRLDEESYRKAFWPDAQINYGTKESISPEQHWSGHMIKGFKGHARAWGHLFTNQAIDIQGDVAHVETYLTVMAIPKPEDAERFGQNIWSGRYVDKLERRNGEWRIAVREYMPHFSMKADITPFDERIWGKYFAGANSDCAQQAAGKRDIAYARPLKRRDRSSGPACKDSEEE